MDDERVDTIAALEQVIGRAPPAIDLKVIDHLDAGALQWVAQSPLAFVCFADPDSVAITIGGGARGFASAERDTICLPIAALDDPAKARPDAGFASLFLIPGIGETLRVNGRIVETTPDDILVHVEECYVHCAKALIRSGFWKAGRIGHDGSAAACIEASRFLALATVDVEGKADLSPKGDPAGSMAILDHGRILYAERPGNKRADSFRNIITRPQVAAMLLVPGSPHVAIISGTAGISTEPPLRARFSVAAKVPAVVTIVDDLALTQYHSAALDRASLWPAGDAPSGINPAKMLVAHVKLNRDRGLGAKAAGAILSIPGLMQRGLDKDYKDNLY